MGIVDKVRTNVDKTMKMMVRNARALPFPEPTWIRNPMAIAGILKQSYTQDIRGMIDVYQVGKEEIGSILCVDAQGKGELRLGKECRGRSSSVVVKDCKPFGIAVGTLHCLPAEELVYIPGFGPLPAEEAFRIFSDADTHFASELIEVKTKLGGEVKVTPNTPFLTTEGWKLAGDLCNSDKIVIGIELPCPETLEIEPPSFKLKNHWQIHHKSQFPTKMTEDLMELLGLVWSDGEVRATNQGARVQFANTDHFLIERFTQLMKEVFQLEVIVEPDANRVYQATINSKLLALFFTITLGFTKENVPSVLWKAPREMRQAFIRGVKKGDGSTNCVSSEKPNDLVTTVYVGAQKQPAISLTYLLATVGIKARIGTIKQSRKNRNFAYTFRVCFQSGNLRNMVPFAKVKSVEHLKGNYVVYDFHTKDHRIYAGTIPFCTHNTHPGSQPALSPEDLEVGILGTYFSCVSWKDQIRRYWLKAVTFDTYYFMPYERQQYIDEEIQKALFLEKQMHNVVMDLTPGIDAAMRADKYIQQLVALSVSIENMLGSYTVEI